MRFLFQKEFQPDVNRSLYQQRGHSSDTRVESSYGVWSALSVLKALHEPRRLNHVLIVGPGLDFAPRTDLIDAHPPQSYQPWTVADALLSLALADRNRLKIQCVDINDRVLDFLGEFPHRPQARLTILRSWDDPEYAEYFNRLGLSVGVPTPIPGGKSLVLFRDEVSRVAAGKLNIITQRYDPSSQFDLIIITNVLVYFDRTELLLALANIHSMLVPGGYLVHNEPRPEVEQISRTLGFPPFQAATLRLSGSGTRALFDTFVIHRKATPSAR